MIPTSITIGEGIVICVDQLIFFLFLFIIACLGSFTHEYLKSDEKIKILKVLIAAFPSTIISLVIREKADISFMMNGLVTYLLGLVSFRALVKVENCDDVIKFIKDIIGYVINK